MHSRIIAASEKEEDLCEISEEDFHDNHYVKRISDYVADIKNDDDTPARWLDLSGLVYDEGDHTLTIKDKEEYFRGKYVEFMEALKELEAMRLEEFVGDRTYVPMITLKYAYDDEYGVYLYGLDYFGGGLCTLDHWVRSMPNGTTIYIGNMVDYHY